MWRWPTGGWLAAQGNTICLQPVFRIHLSQKDFQFRRKERTGREYNIINMGDGCGPRGWILRFCFARGGHSREPPPLFSKTDARKKKCSPRNKIRKLYLSTLWEDTFILSFSLFSRFHLVNPFISVGVGRTESEGFPSLFFPLLCAFHLKSAALAGPLSTIVSLCRSDS